MLKLRRRRQENLTARKTFLPTVILTVVLWLILAALIYFVDPHTTFAIPIFLVVTFLALFLTIAALFDNKRWAVLMSTITIIFLTLKYFGVGNILNLLLLAGLALCVELYLTRQDG